MSHTREDLMSLDLEPSNFLIRPISCPDWKHTKKNYDWGTRLEAGYQIFRRKTVDGDGPMRSREPYSTLDRFRIRLHDTLLRWKVIL